MKTNRLTALVIVTAAFTSAGCLMQPPDGTEADDLEQVQSAVTYDSTNLHPVPTSYLTLKMASNYCCTGLNVGSGCTTPCADSKGLITQAGYDKAFNYYRATGQDALDTLDKWKAFYKFPNRRPGEDLDSFRKRTNIVIYYNRTELALGRELACAQDGMTAIACYVTNFGDSFGSVHDLLAPDADPNSGLAYARRGAQPKNTVVISYDTRRESNYGDGKAVQFAAFGPDGKRLQKAQLDNQGARPIPQICMTCHGGVWDPDGKAANGLTAPTGTYYGISAFARFLPLITSTVTFSGVAPYRLADQEDAIRLVNQAAWRSRGTGLTDRQRQLMGWLYTTTQNNDFLADLNARRQFMMLDTLSFSSSAGGNRQWAENAWPGGWSAKQPFYNGNVLPYCDTCHMAMDKSSTWKDLAGNPIVNPPSRLTQNGTVYTALMTLATATDPGVRNTIRAYMGLTAADANGQGTYGDRGSLLMPHSEQLFERFWSDSSSAGGFTCSFGAPGHCFVREFGIWPNGRAPISNWTPLTPATDLECGQSVTTNGNTTGTNAGRRIISVANGAAYVKECGDGCTPSMHCPGSETASSSPPFPGARQECQAPVGAGVGTCASCGRINEPACTMVGTNCDPAMNPNCKNLPACHEGIVSSGICTMKDLIHGVTVTASQSTTDTTHEAKLAVNGVYNNEYTRTKDSDTAPWWQVDFGSTKKVKYIDIVNRQDSHADRLGNFVVEACTSNCTPTGTGWAMVQTGDFTGVFPADGSDVVVNIPKAVDARYVRFRKLTGGPPAEPNLSVLNMTEVSIFGW